MSHLSEVRNLLGLAGNDTIYTSVIEASLTAGGRLIAELMPPDKIRQFSASNSPGGENAPFELSLTNKKFLEINSSKHFLPSTNEVFGKSLTDVSSIYAKVEGGDTEYYTVSVDKIRLTANYPVITYTYPTYDSENINNLPNEYFYGAVLYSAANSIGAILDKLTLDVTGLTADLAAPTAPVIDALPAAPVIDFLIIGQTPAITTITDAASLSVPLIGNLGVEIPSPPFWEIFPATALPSLVGSIASLSEVVSQTTLSTYAEALLSDMTTSITELDKYFNQLDGSHETGNDTTKGYIDITEDIDLAQIKIHEIQSKLEEIKTELSTQIQQQIANIREKNELAKSNKQLELQGKMNRAQVALDKYGKDLQSWELGVRAYQAKIQTQASEYQTQTQIFQIEANRVLNKFSSDIDLYKSKLQSQLQDYQNKAQYAQGKYQGDIQIYEGKVKRILDTFQYDIQIYQSSVNRSQVDYQMKWEDFKGKLQNQALKVQTKYDNLKGEKEKLIIRQRSLNEQFTQFLSLMFGKGQAQRPQQVEGVGE